MGRILCDPHYEDLSMCNTLSQDCCPGNSACEARGKGISMGTTIIAMRYRDGVILAADSRTSSGPIVADRVARKITRILPNVFMLRSGTAADSQMLSVIIRYHAQALRLQLRRSGRRASDDISNGLDTMQVDCEMSTEYEYTYHYDDTVVGPPIKALATAAHNIVHDYRDQLSCGIMLGGYDLESGPEIYNIPLGGTLIKVNDFVASGSGSGFITAFLQDNYEADMSRERCLQVLRRAIKYAIDNDNSSGGVMRAVAVTKCNVTEFYLTF